MANYEDDRFPKASDGYILSKWYMENKYQVIEILEDTLSPAQLEGFCVGMALKYLSRADANAKLEDYKKAQYYLDYIIKYKSKTEKVKEDRIKPNHYKGGKKIETIDWIEDQLSPEGFEGWCIGLVIKYLCRFQHKNGLEDLVKAQYYMNKFIDKYSKRMESDKCQSK